MPEIWTENTPCTANIYDRAEVIMSMARELERKSINMRKLAPNYPEVVTRDCGYIVVLAKEIIRKIEEIDAAATIWEEDFNARDR